MAYDLPEHLTPQVVSDAGVPPGGLKVFLDGEEVPGQNVMECHTGEGWIIVAKRDAEGHVYVENDEIASERLTGVVTVEVMDLLSGKMIPSRPVAPKVYVKGLDDEPIDVTPMGGALRDQ